MILQRFIVIVIVIVHNILRRLYLKVLSFDATSVKVLGWLIRTVRLYQPHNLKLAKTDPISSEPDCLQYGVFTLYLPCISHKELFIIQIVKQNLEVIVNPFLLNVTMVTE